VTNDDRLRVLFLCTGNSARSQMAEAILRHLTSGEIDVRSAGSDPRPEIHPFARAAIRGLFGIEMTSQRPKPVSELAEERFDYVITVCDRAAASCPTFPGAGERIHWSLSDPAEVTGSEEERRRAFENGAEDLMRRLRLWLAGVDIARRVGRIAES
jgi:ArsR family transcriptional regulator, arsenate/arsenite/antimonite-responsive transcriptional repressor / arsenate reductase (thioredoxin)